MLMSGLHMNAEQTPTDIYVARSFPTNIICELEAKLLSDLSCLSNPRTDLYSNDPNSATPKSLCFLAAQTVLLLDLPFCRFLFCLHIWYTSRDRYNGLARKLRVVRQSREGRGLCASVLHMCIYTYVHNNYVEHANPLTALNFSHATCLLHALHVAILLQKGIQKFNYGKLDFSTGRTWPY